MIMKDLSTNKQLINVLFVVCCFVGFYDGIKWFYDYVDQMSNEKVIVYTAMEDAPDEMHVFITQENGDLSIWNKERGEIEVEVPVPVEKDGASFVSNIGLSFCNTTNEDYSAFYSVFDENHDESYVIKVDKLGSVAWVSAPLAGKALGAPDTSADGHFIFVKHHNGGDTGILTILKGRDGNLRAYSQLRSSTTESDQ